MDVIHFRQSSLIKIKINKTVVLDQTGQLIPSKNVNHVGDHIAIDQHYAYINKKSKLECMQVPCNLYEPLTRL